MSDPLIYIAVALSFVMAGFVKGVIGLGLPTVAIGLMTVFLAPVQAMALLVLPSLVTNCWQLASGGHLRSLLARLWPFLLAMCTGTAAGAALQLHTLAYAPALLGATLVVYAVFGLANGRLAVPARAESMLAPVVGLMTGFMTAATGVFVIPAVPYLQALGLSKDALVQALGLSFTVSTLAMGLALFGTQSFQLTTLGWSFAAIAPALLGMFIGQKMRVRMHPETFRRAMFVALLLLGIQLLAKSF